MIARHALVVDHRSEEDAVLRYLKELVPEMEATHSYDESGGCQVRMSYRGRSVEREYGETPYNCFRIVLEAERLLGPEIGIRVYSPTMGDDTHVFVVLPKEAWDRFDREARQNRKRMFDGVGFLDAGWGLSGPDNRQNKWWQIWK
jgi:hypothetical protein